MRQQRCCLIQPNMCYFVIPDLVSTSFLSKSSFLTFSHSSRNLHVKIFRSTMSKSRDKFYNVFSVAIVYIPSLFLFYGAVKMLKINRACLQFPLFISLVNLLNTFM